MSLRAKDHLEGTKVAAFPSVLRPDRKSRPAAQRLAATKEWRPGRRRATRLPTEERATQRARESSMWVRVTVTSKKARRTGAVKLLRYAACYGRWLLSKARPPPSPSGLRFSFWASVPPSKSSFGAPVTTVNGADVAETSWWIASPITTGPEDRERCREVTRCPR